MPEWLTNTFASDTELGLRASLARLTVALVLGIAVAGIYRFTRGARTQRPLLATLVMLSVLLSITTLVIGDNVARAFSIVGALSIVRFRTVVNDTRDTAFVIFAVAVGMAAGAGYFMIPFVSLPFVFLAAWMFDPRTTNRSSKGLAFELTVKIASGSVAESTIVSVLANATKRCALRGMSTMKSGAAFERVYTVRLDNDAASIKLVEMINAIEGVQSVDLKRD